MNTDEFFPWLTQQDVKHELVDGHPVKFEGVTLQHDDIVGNALVLFRTALKSTKWKLLSSQIGVKIPNGNVRYPDLSVDAGAGNQDDMWATDPVLAVLVLSDSPDSKSWDFIDKIDDFKVVMSLKYLLLLDAGSPRTRLYVRSATGKWLNEKSRIAGRIRLPEIDVEFPVTDLYAGQTVTTAEAAEYLDCGRVSIAQLCEGKNLESETSSSGERRISLDSLVTWKQANPGIDSSEIRKANAEMGLYDIPEEEFLENIRRLDEK